MVRSHCGPTQVALLFACGLDRSATRVERKSLRPLTRVTCGCWRLALTRAALQLVPERVHATTQASAGAAPGPRAFEPTSRERYKVQFTASRELRDKIERLRELTGAVDLAAAIDEAVSDKLARLEARRFALTKKPRPASTRGCAGAHSLHSSRHIPAEVRRAVHLRDGGQCVYTDAQGRRCTSRRHLEFHHRQPYGHGGKHTIGNTCLLCSTHHALMTKADFAPRDGGPVPVLEEARPSTQAEPSTQARRATHLAGVAAPAARKGAVGAFAATSVHPDTRRQPRTIGGPLR
jgi:5-methylcytosine-specific restriction endonuclease McrA